MDSLLSFFQSLLANKPLVYGLLFLDSFLTTFPVAGIVVLETPVLILAGWFAAQGLLDVWLVSAVCITGGIIGDAVGYVIGKRLGLKALQHPWIVNHRNWAHAHEFMTRHGGKSIVIARFIAPLRTVLPLVAGVTHMPSMKFWLYNVSGAIVQTVAFVALGYWFGAHWKTIVQWSERGGIVLLVVFLFALAFWYWLGAKENPSTT